MVDILIALAIVIIMYIFFFVVIYWSFHIFWVISENKTYGIGGYKEFKREFNKVEWFHRNEWKWSLFGKDYYSFYAKDEFFNNNIKFNSNGMLIHNPISLMLVHLYVRRYIKKRCSVKVRNRKKITNKWY